MTNITRLPSVEETIHIEADIPRNPRDEFDCAMREIVAGRRSRMEALAQNRAAIEARALAGLRRIERAINMHPGTGSAARLVRFLAGVYNGSDYSFDLAQLRKLDDELASACLDYLNYDRLGSSEVHRRFPGGEHVQLGWLEEYGVNSVRAPR